MCGRGLGKWRASRQKSKMSAIAFSMKLPTEPLSLPAQTQALKRSIIPACTGAVN